MSAPAPTRPNFPDAIHEVAMSIRNDLRVAMELLATKVDERLQGLADKVAKETPAAVPVEIAMIESFKGLNPIKALAQSAHLTSVVQAEAMRVVVSSNEPNPTDKATSPNKPASAPPRSFMRDKVVSVPPKPTAGIEPAVREAPSSPSDKAKGITPEVEAAWSRVVSGASFTEALSEGVSRGSVAKMVKTYRYLGADKAAPLTWSEAREFFGEAEAAVPKRGEPGYDDFAAMSPVAASAADVDTGSDDFD